MDHRIETFETTARETFGFLTDLGFATGRSEATDLRRRPAQIAIAFHRTDARVETRLVLEFGGDDSVVTTLNTLAGEVVLSPRVARKGHELDKALRSHADDVRAVIEKL